MGPQLVSCGCDQRIECEYQHAWGFNGAAARELRMRGGWRLRRRGFRFNGAAARELRMRQYQPGARQAFSRFNGAAARELRMLACFQQLDESRLASMGPQLVSCGCAAGCASSKASPTASMGPQLVSCGCFRRLAYTRADIALQWGRSS